MEEVRGEWGMVCMFQSLGLQVPSEKVELEWVWRVQKPSEKVLGALGNVLCVPFRYHDRCAQAGAHVSIGEEPACE